MDGLDEFGIGGEAVRTPGLLHRGLGADVPSSNEPLTVYPFEPISDLVSYTRVAIPALQRRFAAQIKLQSGRTVRQIATVVVPVQPIGVFNPEDLYPDEALGWAGQVAVQVAAQVSVAACFNPANSNVECTIEAWQAQRLNTAGLVLIQQAKGVTATLNATPWGNATSVKPRDLRFLFDGTKWDPFPLLNNVVPLVIVSGNAKLPGGVNCGMVGSGAVVSPAVSEKPIVLQPDQAVSWSPLTLTGTDLVNEGIALTVWVRLRPLDVQKA